MNDCLRFDAWLDSGSPLGGASAAREHARTCVRCAAAMHAMESVEERLACEPDVPAPAALASVVMARVAATPQHVHTPASTHAARALREPSVIGSLALAALLVWQAGALRHIAGIAAAALAQGAAGTREWHVPASLADVRVLAAFALALAVPAAWAVVTLWRESERLARLPIARR